ncbi:glycosyl hydrolase [Jiangella aurantiaca]|nr:glycosyl hydrolase [Jiangella aurantiaca]
MTRVPRTGRLSLGFAALALLATALPGVAVAQPTTVALGQTSPGNIFATGATPSFEVSTPASSVSWTVHDYWGDETAVGTTPVTDGRALLQVPVDAVGYYELHVTAADGGGAAETSFAVLPEADRSATDDLRFGAQTHFAHGWDPEILVPLLTNIGVQTVRDAQQWQLIETAPGTYDFTVENGRFETFMEELGEASVEPLLNFGLYSPHHDGGATPYTDEGRQAFARFVQEVLAHYGDQIRSIGVYNEPNTPKFGDRGDGLADARPDYHAALAQVVSDAVQEVRPDVEVVAPELLAKTQDFAEGLPWLAEYLRAGGAEALDVVSVHPYRACCTPETLPADIADLRRVMDENGAADAPIWFSELGWPTNDRSEHTTERAQAQYLPRSYVLAFSEGVARYYWYNFMDHNSGPFGLLRRPGDPQGDYTPKPSYVAYAVMTAQLSGLPYDGADRVPGGVHSHRFSDGVTAVRAMWAPEAGTEVRLMTPRPLQVTDTMGVTRTITPYRGAVSLTLSGDPLYVRGNVKAVLHPRGAR